METKPWYQSKIIWTSVIGALSGVLALFGYNVDPATQTELTNDLSILANTVAIISPILITIFRAKSNTVLTPTKDTK